jgi:hypothetical protein
MTGWLLIETLPALLPAKAIVKSLVAMALAWLLPLPTLVPASRMGGAKA